MRRFLHLIKNPDGSPCCIWRELESHEVEFSMMRTDIHCLCADPFGGPFEPDHCQDGEVIPLAPSGLSDHN